MSNLDHDELIYYLISIKRNFIHFRSSARLSAPCSPLPLDNEEMASTSRTSNLDGHHPPTPGSIRYQHRDETNEPFILSLCRDRQRSEFPRKDPAFLRTVGQYSRPCSLGRIMNICLLGYRSNPFSGGQGVYLYYLSRALVRRVTKWTSSRPPYPELDPRVTLIQAA